MEFQFPFNFIFLFLFLSFLYLLLVERKKSRNLNKKLPPGPWKLPFLGNLHHLALEGGLPHHALTNLGKKYGPFMHFQLGEISTVVVSSMDMAREVLKTHDLAFASRPKLEALDIICYKSTDIAFSPYGDYWRQMRKVCIMELLTAKNVRSFSSIRRDEASLLVQFIRSSTRGKPINVREHILRYESSITCKAAFGNQLLKDREKFIGIVSELVKLAGGFSVSDIFPSIKILQMLSGLRSRILKVHKNVDVILENIIKEHKKNIASDKKGNGALRGEDLVDVLLRLMESGELKIPITNDNIKAVMIDLFSAGTETSSTTTIWAMTEMMRNPSLLAKAQAEVREAFKGKELFNEDVIEELKYLKQVVKETFRLHPPLPLLVPRECREETNINGYTIPLKTRVMVNVWAMGRDPKYWEDAESFKPERFEESSVDFMGNNFEYLPFGAGRRMCPGITFGLVNVHLPLANLLYHFDWKLPDGVKPEDLDFTETSGITAARKNDLYLIATPYYPSQE
ncbi:premnaspirodiene oxygenase-like [Solanum dulcamara]|uniref:premnaspirodiene oxygenase-like n=1 Tax=Solanum dulcamara TaxID=45834 RepID=UPI002486A11E|nr:premnaspirodiene oxygenase-like [Solanum dulcamara]